MADIKPGDVLGRVDVDEWLSLEVRMGNETPRLVIENKATNKKRNTMFSWLEKESRELKIKIKAGKIQSYAVGTITEAVSRLSADVLAQPQLKGLIWQIFRLLSQAMHTPKVVSRESEYRMLSEEKRMVLWLMWSASGNSQGSLRPCFRWSDKEENILSKHVVDAGAWRGILMDPGDKGAQTLQKKGIATSLMRTNPERWFKPLMLASAAESLGMSDWSGSEESKLCQTLWKGILSANSGSDLLSDKDEIIIASATLARRLTGFIRHFDILPRIEWDEIADGADILKNDGFTRKQRFEELGGVIGDVDYTVTTFVHDDGRGAIVCSPNNATTMHKGDIVIKFPQELFDQALVDDSCGSLQDGKFTAANMVKAKQMEIWIGRLEEMFGKSLTLTM